MSKINTTPNPKNPGKPIPKPKPAPTNNPGTRKLPPTIKKEK